MDITEIILAIPILLSVYGLLELYKFILKRKVTNDAIREKWLKWIPVIAGGLGTLLGAICFYIIPSFLNGENTIWEALLTGAVSGLAATGIHQIIKQQLKNIGITVKDEEALEKLEDVKDAVETAKDIIGGNTDEITDDK